MFLSIFVGFSRQISKFTLNCAYAQMKALLHAKRSWNLANGQVYEYNCVAKRNDEGLMESRLSYARKALQNGRLFIGISVQCQALNGSADRLPLRLKRVSGNCFDNDSRRTIDMRGVSRAWSSILVTFVRAQKRDLKANLTNVMISREEIIERAYWPKCYFFLRSTRRVGEDRGVSGRLVSWTNRRYLATWRSLQSSGRNQE